jgi:hypothetical protein
MPRSGRLGVMAFFDQVDDPSSIARFYLFELIAVAFILAIASYALVSNSYNVAGSGLLYPSLMCYLACFTLTSFFLKRQGARFLDRLLISVLSMVSGIILFEIVYHYGFGVPSFDYFFAHDLAFLGNQSANGYFSLDWYLLIFSSLFVARKYMAMNLPFFALVLIGGIVMFAWIGSGYPQLFNPPWVADYLPIYHTFHVVYSSPSMIVQYARYYNGVAKIISIIPALLFYKTARIGLPNSTG